MLKGNYITIEPTKNLNGEYIIKDKLGITIGRITIIEHLDVNKYCCMRLRFYKDGPQGELLLEESIRVFLNYMFRECSVYKVSIIVDEEMDTSSFVKLGFDLEGIISNSILDKNMRRDEIIFGINYSIFKGAERINVLRYKGRKIEIKILTPDDAKQLENYYIRNKEYLKPFEPSREDSFYTLEAQRQILMESYKQFLNGLGVTFGIYNTYGNFIGKIQISGVIYGVFKSAYVGYSIDKDEQGKGYMKEALGMVLDYAFEEMELHRVEASTLIDNKRSQGVLKACGFDMLGINKKYLFINGQWRDHVTFYKTI
ncbi:MAG: GNAT family protein [Bacillota bacterium]|nr:GNAT family protein [Bacillota bacterium]